MPTPDSPRLVQTHVHRLGRPGVCSDIHVLFSIATPALLCLARGVHIHSSGSTLRASPAPPDSPDSSLRQHGWQACRTIRGGAMIGCAKSQRLRSAAAKRHFNS
jgi:hypothetical protein